MSMAKFTSQEVAALQEGGNQVDMNEFCSDPCQMVMCIASFLLSYVVTNLCLQLAACKRDLL